ncbi:DUF1653 domain-containing protein [Saccharospirillum alexandrii]|uniref:DUF1653 domain-containing protein n=1 Tax=Saccharospirillum alexandrii TaxID=2448477 RepID=UPI000FD99324|nr:DUF1653 domain-containing protein [Saccharospirillum alexandrii]
MKSLTAGIYRHYKGNRYRVIGVSRHSETNEQLVVYQCLYGDYSLWVRPLDMFTELVRIDGEDIPRFERVQSLDEADWLSLAAEVSSPIAES